MHKDDYLLKNQCIFIMLNLQNNHTDKQNKPNWVYLSIEPNHYA